MAEQPQGMATVASQAEGATVSQRSLDMIAAVGDKRLLESFRRAKMAGYFRLKARMYPETKEESLKLSRIFTRAAAAEKALARKDVQYTPEQAEKLQGAVEDANAAVQGIHARYEDGAVDAFAFARIREFVKQNPQSWARLQRVEPELVRQVGRYKPRH
jgi:hypothetical protein